MRRRKKSREELTLVLDRLKDCVKSKDLEAGSRLHADILRRGMILESNLHVASALISMYAKCGALAKADQMLQELPVRDIVAWNGLISGYLQHGQYKEALDCFERMQRKEGLSPDGVTLTSILKACGSIGSIEKGKQIHGEIVDKGLLKKHVALGNALIDMYSRCHMLTVARQVLESLPSRNVVSWSTLIARYAQVGQGHEALRCFEQMQGEGISPNEVTFICVLKACGSVRDIEKGKQIHDQIASLGLLEKNITLGNTLIDMYVKCRVLEKGRQVLEELPIRDTISWNTLISGHVQEGQSPEALECFTQMQREGLSSNRVTFICILKACANLGAIDTGKRIHDEIVARGLQKKNIMIGTALVDMYAKCGALDRAQEVLEGLPTRDAIAWSALITGYAQDGKGHEALDCFARMKKEGLSPDDVTFTSILKACGSIGAIGQGKQIHDDIVRKGLLKRNVMLGNALINMYARCGDLAKAQDVLESMPTRNVISWNTLITGYAQEQKGHEALKSFGRMQKEGLRANEITFTCILKACGNVGAIDKGKQIHDEIISGGWLHQNLVLGNALVDMYAKCGVLTKAKQVLEGLPVRDAISWSALIYGYAQEGHCDEVVRCFKEMLREGIVPNAVTFLCLLSACSHTGKLNEAEMYYEDMSRKYGVLPQLEHHTCMVVVFGCTGRFDKALSVIKTMPYSDDASVWLALLGACRKWGNVKLGKLAFQQAVQLDDSLASAYIVMANIYADAGMQEDAERVRKDMRSDCTIWKNPRLSILVDGNGNVQSLSVGKLTVCM